MEIYVCRHGETEWSRNGRHTGLTDLSLTSDGEEQARCLGQKLKGQQFDAIYSSPLQRALRTAELAGFSPELEPDLLEWNYGDYEGLTTPQIHEQDPDWSIFKSGAPGGESVAEVGARADHFLERLAGKRILLFSSGHFSRVLAARWLGLPADGGRYFTLGTASLSILGTEHDQPAIKLWNEIFIPLR